MNHQPFGETSEELTDWEEDLEEDLDSCDEDEQLQSKPWYQISDRLVVYCEDGNSLIQPTVQRAKQILVDRLVQQFWSKFPDYHDRENDFHEGMLHVDRVRHTGRNPVYEQGENVRSSALQSNDLRAAKRVRTSTSVPQSVGASTKFACPYRKHDPRKYCVPDWGPCALTPLETVARVKAHLYLYHRVHQYPRCKGVFDSQEDLETHVEAAAGCEPRPEQSVDGVTSKLMERLRSRKKAFPGQTETDKWREVYQLLFPKEALPSPYFEHIKDNSGVDLQPSTSREVTKYEDYLRQELPRFFRNALDSAVSEEMQPIEERLSRKMMEILEEAQKLAFSTYRSMIEPAAVDSPTPGLFDQGSHLLAVNNNSICPKEPSDTSCDIHEPSGANFLFDFQPNSRTPLHFSELSKRQEYESQHASPDINEDALSVSDEHAKMSPTANNKSTDSRSKSPLPSTLASEMETSLPLPGHQKLVDSLRSDENNTAPNLDDLVESTNAYSGEWISSLEEINVGDFDWNPSWEVTTPSDDAWMDLQSTINGQTV